MGERKLLCLKPDGVEAGFDLQSLNRHWDVLTISDTKRLRELSASGDFRVGLALLGDKADAGYQDTVLADSPVEWVAMLPASGLAHEGLRRLIQSCFFDFHTLPADLDRLEVTLGHAYGMASLKTSTPPSEGPQSEYQMVGASPIMRRLFRNIRKVAHVDAPVLIQGESGTGKELAALAVHERSERANGPFVAVNCGALPANLIQSELFGYEKGAFTGAQQRKLGRLESASGGTVFLDEIGDLPLDQQTSLLRFLQEQKIERVGSNQSIHVDVRVIAATHVNLEQAVREGHFREDLYYRLNVLRLDMPPLRERLDDVETLARFFFERFSADRNPQVRGFSQQALQSLREHHWPGNVRELINRVRRSMIMCEKRLIGPAELGLERGTGLIGATTLSQARAQAEQAAIQQALEHTRGNVSQAARRLGVSRVTLYRLMDKFRLSH
ncbi:sigma-54 dependent transcriptional regulator [Alkalilimnicola sp. S0819]|uniref:sigma-54 dependent transcriptional regulator n=1 Tax=Alkalilimnicola sp. S0819 TaxID=2613922 RepID=UPI0012628528|nr:sigma-54 dependent transcriptional regulator [Alkalilimnicola sp. S0819]KAB7624396.1 sigma-54-dependent Fis family transcriptional regulator [Alkalilimnicola sp. S0819]MPQ16223.1 AAA domain-containing protein [Alkalilimnicola sp. S0819]